MRIATLIVIAEVVMKIIAFLKQSIVAYYFGATSTTDIYFVANDFIVSISEILISALKVAVISVYTSLNSDSSNNSRNSFIFTVSYFMFFITFLVAFGLYWFSPYFAILIAPYFTEKQFLLLVEYIRILAPIICIAGIVVILEAILNANKVFFVTRIRSFLYSVFVMLLCYVIIDRDITVLMVSQYLSYIVYVFTLLLYSRKYVNYSAKSIINRAYIGRVVILMFPVMIGDSIVRINYIIGKAIASSYDNGAISALAYCQQLDQFVVAVIITSLSCILFAHFADMVARGRLDEIKSTLDSILNYLTMLMLPISTVVLLEAENIVTVIFKRGFFDDNAVNMTAIALQGYCLRYGFVSIRDIIIQAQYAYKESVKPMFVSLISTLINIGVCLALSERYGILSIAMGTTISSFVGMLFNIYFFKKIAPFFNFSCICKLYIQSIPLLSVVYFCWSYFSSVFFMEAFFEFLACTLFVFITYYIYLYFLENPYAISIKNIFLSYTKCK